MIAEKENESKTTQHNAPLWAHNRWMSPIPAQGGLLFPCLSQRALLFLSLAQRGLLFPHPAQRETLFSSAALSVTLPVLGIGIWCVWARARRVKNDRPLLPPTPLSPSAHHQYGASPTGLTVSIITVAGESLAFTSSL